MKKLLSIVLAVMLAVCACSFAVADEGTKLKVALITDTGGIHDESFNQLAWNGLNKAKEELGIEVQYFESVTEADYEGNLEQAFDEGYDLIIANGFLMADAVTEACANHPEQLYAIIDNAAVAENCVGIQFATEQCSYLCGVAAATMSQTGKVGFVIGMVSPTMNTFGVGYFAGVLATNPDAEIFAYNANSFVDVAAGKAAAIDMYAQGADVVYHAAGGVGIGVIEAASEQGKFAIGVDQDQNYLAPTAVIASALKKVDAGVFNVCEALFKGTLTGGDVFYDITTASVDIATTGGLLSEDALTAVAAAKAAILDGTLVVPNTVEAFAAEFGEGIYTLE